MTAVPPLDAELTPVEVWRPDELDELDEFVELDVVDWVSSDEVEVAELLAGVAEVLPGMVAALTALNSPTPATAAKAAPTVRRLSRRIAASRARIRRSVAWVLSMANTVGLSAKSYVGER